MINRLSYAGARPERLDRLAPKRQGYWDWRAAGNFIGGGAGGGLLFFAPWAAWSGAAFAPLALAALALVALGLTCVWLEIGRPWRALNVFRHPASSWMTREASVAPLMFVAGLLAASVGHPLLLALSAGLGLGFVYAQARILTADKGIPAWRHRRCVPLVVSTGVTEGAGLLALASPWLAPDAAGWLPLVLGTLLVLRTVVWRAYLAGLQNAGAPRGALAVLHAFEAPFVVAGHVVPIALLALGHFDALAGWRQPLLGLAAALAVAAGWALKYTLVRKAAYSQGFALPHQPVRGRGQVGKNEAGARPGW
jgi:phenylacetyl-CoA:acceptor oxidoreductase 26-kDa subunit